MTGITPIDPTAFYRSLPMLQPAGSASAGDATQSFSQMITSQLQGVIGLQNQGDQAAQSLATGTATNIASATTAVEKASIALELVGAFRNKAIDAYTQIMQMQI
jgi:flagellar hook-basal body complex protein FliE